MVMAPPLSAFLMTIYLSVIRLFRAFFSSVGRLWKCKFFLDFIKVFRCPLTWLTNVSMHKLRPAGGVHTVDLCAVWWDCKLSELLLSKYSAKRTLRQKISVLWQSLTSSNLEVGQKESPLFNNVSSAMMILRLDKFITLLSVVRWCLGFTDANFTFVAFKETFSNDK